MSATAIRATAAAVSGTCALVALTLVGAVRERDRLPVAAHAFLQATIVAGSVTTCLQGAQDDLFLPGVGRLHTAAAVSQALGDLQSCDISGLAHAVDAVRLPPAAPVSDTSRREARNDIARGIGILRQVVVDAGGADRAMTANVRRSSDGSAVVLTYRAASTGSDEAYALALQALALLGQPQTSVGG